MDVNRRDGHIVCHGCEIIKFRVLAVRLYRDMSIGILFRCLTCGETTWFAFSLYRLLGVDRWLTPEKRLN